MTDDLPHPSLLTDVAHLRRLNEGRLIEDKVIQRYRCRFNVVSQARGPFDEREPKLFTGEDRVRVRGRRLGLPTIIWVLMGNLMPERDQHIIMQDDEPRMVPRGLRNYRDALVLDEIRDDLLLGWQNQTDTRTIRARQWLQARHVGRARSGRWQILEGKNPTLLEEPRGRSEAVSRLEEWQDYYMQRGAHPEPLESSLWREMEGVFEETKKAPGEYCKAPIDAIAAFQKAEEDKKKLILVEDNPALATILGWAMNEWRLAHNAPLACPSLEVIALWMESNPSITWRDVPYVVD